MTPAEFGALALAHDRREFWRVAQIGKVVATALGAKPSLTFSPFMPREAPKPPDWKQMRASLLAAGKGRPNRKKAKA